MDERPSAGDDDLLASREPVVEWYRPDPMRRIVRIFLPAVLSITFGSLLVFWGVTHVQERDPARVRAMRAPFGPIRPGPGVPGPAPVADPDDLDATPFHADFTPLETALFVGGFLLVIAGPLSVISRLHRVMQTDEYLLLRTDGALVRLGKEKKLVTWDELDSVVYDSASGAIELRMRDDVPPLRLTQRFAGIDAEALAKRLEEVRRKAIWKVLPQQR